MHVGSLYCHVCDCQLQHNANSHGTDSHAIARRARIDGRVQLPNQWSFMPAGTQRLIGDLPVNMKLHPDGKHLAILHAGFGPHEVIILKLDGKGDSQVVSRSVLKAAFYGLDFSPDGKHFYCSGGTSEQTYRFDFEDGELGSRVTISLVESKEEICVPAGVTVSRDGKKIFVAGNRGHKLRVLDAWDEVDRLVLFP